MYANAQKYHQLRFPGVNYGESPFAPSPRPHTVYVLILIR